MKHIFIINPAAGKSGAAEALVPKIEAIFSGHPQDCEIYRTTCEGDATRFTRERCKAADGEHLRFYSCGGDGTMNEVLQGLADFPDVALGVIPCGSGNDFVRSFPALDFTDLALQVASGERAIDLIRFNGSYSANLCSAGMDSDVCKKMTTFKRWPFVSGSGAYILALICVFFSHLGKRAHLVLDDGRVFDENVLLMAMGNGGFYGGGWKGAPKFDVTDGLMDLCMIRKISRLRMAKVVGRYKQGLHADDASMKDVVIYTRCKSLHITFDKPTTLNADGQVSESTEVDAEILPLALQLVYPLRGDSDT